MKINFRQGIVSRQSGQFLQVVGDNVDLLATNRSATVTLAVRDTDYTHSEDNTVASAWVGPFPVDSNPAKANAYLYWDFDPLTFERTFGWTTLAPAAQSVAPGTGNTAIIGVVPTAASPIAPGSFEVAGQYVLTSGKTIAVINSTGNDGTYTVQSATYSTTSGTTTIVVNEAITDTTVDGDINLDFDVYGQPLKQTGRTWYDTANHIHYELNVANQWIEVIRVFAARLNNANSFFSMSRESDFTGSQIGDTSSVFAGRVLFAETNNPITRDDGTFFTTEDQFFTNQSRVDALRLESNVSRAKSVSGGTLAAFGIVAWVGDGEITTAQYNDTGSTVVGVLTENTNNGEVGAVIVQGTVTNPDWAWDSLIVGKSLWIENGALVSTDPHVSDPITYLTKQVPVARVLSGDTVIFEQGLGGVGPQGTKGTITDIPLANNELVQGVVSLSHAPANDLFPIAAGENHPVLTSGPYSVDGHGHTATEISFEIIPGSIDSTDVQNAIAELNNKKLSLSGGTMTNFLTLHAQPSDNLHAATKSYVDALAQGLDAKESAIVGTTANLGGAYVSPAGPPDGIGDNITGASISSLDGAFGTDYYIIVTSRVLVKDQTNDLQNGIYVVTALGAGSPPTTFDLERSSDFDEDSEIRAGNYVFLRAGLLQSGTGWALTDIHPEDDIELNIHPITWTLVSSATAFTPDETTITIDGLNVVSTKQASAGGTVNALQWNSNDITLGSPPSTGQILVYDASGFWTNTDLVSDICDLTVVCTPTSDTIISTKETFALNIDSNTGLSISNTPSIAASGWDISSFASADIGTFAPVDLAEFPNYSAINAKMTPDGTKLIVLYGLSQGPYMEVFPLTVPFDISSATAVGYPGLLYPDENNEWANASGRDLYFSPDGLNLFIETDRKQIFKYPLDIAYDVWSITGFTAPGGIIASTAQSIVMDSPDTVETWLYHTNDGINYYFLGFDTNTVYHYAASVAWDITTITFNTSQELATDGFTSTTNSSVIVSDDGTKLWATVTGPSMYEWTLTVPFDVTSKSFVGIVTNALLFATPGHVFWSEAGANLYWLTPLSGNVDTFHQYNTGVAATTGVSYTSLYYNGTSTLSTTSSGVEVDGILTFAAVGSPSSNAQIVLPNYLTADLPTTNLDGGTVFDTDTNDIKFWNGIEWKPAGNKNWVHANIGADFPTSPNAPGTYSIAIGDSAKTLEASAISIGTRAYARRVNTIAIGVDAYTATSAVSAISIGHYAYTDLQFGVAIGRYAKAYGVSSIAIGNSSQTQQQESISIGINNNTLLDGQVAIGGELLGTDVNSDVSYSVKLGTAKLGFENILHLFSKGKLELYGDEAQFVAPNHPTTSLVGSPLTVPGESGGIVFDSTTNELKVFNNTEWAAVGTGGGAAAPPDYEKIVIGGSPVSQVLNTNVSTIATAGSPIGVARLQVFRNGILQNEDTTSGSPIDGDFEVTGANQLTFAPDSLQPGGVVIIYTFS